VRPQAACLHPVLRDKVRAWALASGGMFPAAEGPARLVRLADVDWQPGEVAPAVKFAKLKSVSRAIEKVLRPAPPSTAAVRVQNGARAAARAGAGVVVLLVVGHPRLCAPCSGRRQLCHLSWRPRAGDCSRCPGLPCPAGTAVCLVRRHRHAHARMRARTSARTGARARAHSCTHARHTHTHPHTFTRARTHTTARAHDSIPHPASHPNQNAVGQGALVVS
jgi:hypothetical protein